MSLTGTGAGDAIPTFLFGGREWLSHGCGPPRQIGRLRQLHTLELDGCQGLTDACVQLLQAMPRLRVARLSRCHFLTDLALEHLTAVAPALRCVDVSHCFRISDNGFALLAQLPELEPGATR